MDDHLNEMSKKFGERKYFLTNHLKDFRKNQSQQSLRGSLPGKCGRISSFCEDVVLASMTASLALIKKTEDLH